jgi:DDE_Tnp_1-associated/Transposase DDE domain
MLKKRQELKSHKDISEQVLLQFVRTLDKFYPSFNNLLKSLADPRDKNKCDYHLEDLLWLSLLMMITSSDSRNNYNHELRYCESLELLKNLFGLELSSVPHGDTLAYLWQRFDYHELEKLRQAMVMTLIKGRYLEKFRFRKTYLVVFDGVELYRWDKKHCDNCLYAEFKEGKYQYFHRVLEAKIVCSNGFAISIASEFIENYQLKEDNKQDCELKAFHRLAAKVKELFPRLPVTILADSLYPNNPVFKRCSNYKWNYLFVLHETVLTSVWEDFHGMFELTETAIGAKLLLDEFLNEKRRYRWVNELEYQSSKVNILAIASEDDKGIYQTKRAFITNHEINKKSARKIEEVGQLRWKIENQGFDIQKHHGYNLEHTYSKHPNAMKVVYLLIQIAHIINQLFIEADILDACKDLSLKSCFRKLLEAIHQGWTLSIANKWEIISHNNYQARFQPP